jgi:hypothetical protein
LQLAGSLPHGRELLLVIAPPEILLEDGNRIAEQKVLSVKKPPQELLLCFLGIYTGGQIFLIANQKNESVSIAILKVIAHVLRGKL